MKFLTSVIKHSEISEEQLIEICRLKSIRWDYNLDQHKRWMIENIQANDFHILIKDEEKPIAYTNLVDITAIINDKNIKVRGIGNVCTSETGKGFGNILMEEVNAVLAQNQWKGILLCKDNLVPYYEKFNWKLINSDKIMTKKFENTNFMNINFSIEIDSLEYNDRNF
ncbi:GNAT family N-acetyltransferase [Chryseobacterium gotjawalense]|uniref:GNAT family N-acetyltransferase n=1 Tax=Chryseobacterium gotjawalense TaxID=3042315 RepID=A0ABY8RH31_9FLAO|nr:GNAT family N-acetyltransferase [Chryseobacterium sp. wdc7]WHF53059.1 GNAT family N-acetyltransferase [Chryseobacterium sp. wdc7]